MTQRLQQRAVDASAVSAEAGVGAVAAVPATDLPGQTQTPAGGVSVASSDGVTASPGPAPSAGTVLSEPAATAAAGARAHTRASPASPGSSASSPDPIRDMDFDNVPALRSLERPGSRALRAGAQRRAGGRPAQYLERAPADTSSAEGPHRAGLGLQDERQSGEAVAPLRGIACQGGCGCQGGCFVVRAERH